MSLPAMAQTPAEAHTRAETPEEGEGLADTVLRQLGLSAQQCAHVRARAAALGVGPESVAIAWGLIDEDAFYACLARAMGLPFVAHPFPIDRHFVSPHGLDAGMTRSADGRVIMAPCGDALRAFIAANPQSCALTSPRILRGSLSAAFRVSAALSAAAALSVIAPHETAQRDGSASGFIIAAWLVALVALVVFEPAYAWPVTVPLSLLFAWTIGQRITAIASRHDLLRKSPPRALTSLELPFYSVLVPLYREDAVLAQLIGALEALDYPPEKLEILLLVEEDDATTRKALAQIRLQPHMRIVSCPDGAPRTKPRALNVGLMECSGEFVAVYDAEDVPDRDQLAKAAALFRASDEDVACLQAEIVIDNGEANFLTRGFALEYAALFQIVVPGLCAFDLPVALGGTSNHFRRSVLNALNGWDAWNVTEDADLGLRLALHGYRVAHLPSRTWEEAPVRFPVWRKQRIRWIKGWMQTSLVHLRIMRERWHVLSLAGKIGLLHHLVGTPLSVLLTPLLSVALIAGLFSDRSGLFHQGTMALGSALALSAVVMMAALYTAAAPQLGVNARRRAILAMPVYLLFVCGCAWLAVAELVRAPFHWNKTPHGESLPEPVGQAPARRGRRKTIPPVEPSEKAKRLERRAKRKRKLRQSAP